jgi:general secretion pathway protein E
MTLLREEVVPRLADLGVTPTLLSSTLQAVLAQRLCRKLCAHCRVEERPPPELLPALRAAARRLGKPEVSLYQPRGCAACRYTGYHGRVGLFELVEIGARQRDQLVKGVVGAELMHEHLARQRATLYEDGLSKALLGLTSLAELLRTLEPELRQVHSADVHPTELDHAQLPVPRADS